MIIKLRTDDGRHLGAWRVPAEAELTPELLKPLLDALAHQRKLEALRASDAPNAVFEAIMAEFEAEDRMLAEWDG